MSSYDVAVVGGGLRGMRAAACAVAARPGARVLCVEATPAPGGDVKTQRSNGFVCELGPFAFTREELDFWMAPLEAPPRVVAASDRARTGWLFDGDARRPLRVEPEPCSFPTGCEDLVQGYRRQLGEALRLGREVTAVAPRDGEGFALTLGGEVPTELRAKEVVLAVPDDTSAKLLAAFEPELPQVAARVTRAARAFAWFGGIAQQAPELTGYGVLPHPALRSSVAELIFCTEAFEQRAMPDRVLVRAEVTADADVISETDDALLAATEAELRRWTETEAPFGFTKVHRFSTVEPGGDATECEARVAEIARRAPGLSIALPSPS
jgi:protoporphyrinogen oxidase